MCWSEGKPADFAIRFGNEVYYPGVWADFHIDTTHGEDNEKRVTKNLDLNQKDLLFRKSVVPV